MFEPAVGNILYTASVYAVLKFKGITTSGFKKIELERMQAFFQSYLSAFHYSRVLSVVIYHSFSCNI